MDQRPGRGLLLAVLPMFLGPALLMAQQGYSELDYPPLRNVQVPPVEQRTLSNGIRLFLLEDHELPLVNLSATIRVGSIHEPAGKIGLAAITGSVMRTGGTRSLSGDEIDERLESIAASVETDIGLDSGSASMSVLREDLDEGLAVLAEILMAPAFAEEKIELARVQARSGISRRNDRVDAIASREFRKLIYGEDSPYARHPEYNTVANITRQDLIDFHARYFHPNRVMMALWGDFDTSDLVARLEHVFRDWKPVEGEVSPPPAVDYTYRESINLIEKEDLTQTNIFMGHLGGMRDDPDYFALSLMNRILGSGFTSRLFKEVRSRLGLAYSVFGYFSASYTYPGVFYVGCQTKSETTVQAIRAMRQEVEKMTRTRVTDQELELARQSFLNAFVFNFDSRGEVVNRLMTYAYYGYPLDFLQKVKDSVERVTVDDILRVARKHLRPEKMQILAVGKSDDFDEPLSVLGPVHAIDITIPQP